MRCLTLAEDLIKQGMEVFFITRDLPGNMAFYIQEKGYPVLLLSSFESSNNSEFDHISDHWRDDAAETVQAILQNKEDGSESLLVVDHYSLDQKWEQALRAYVDQVMVIDDLANRRHDCDSLLDQNYYKAMNERYRGLVPDHCQLLLGPKHALLRQEFYKAKRHLRQRDGKVRRVLIFFGGSDPTHETVKTLEALKILGRPDIITDVVVGSSNPQRVEVEAICTSMPFARFHCQVGNMAELMAGADLAVGAGGTTSLERCFLGLPTLVITVADNQVETTRDLAETGAIWYLGESETVSWKQLAETIQEASNEPQKLVEMSRKCLELFQ